MENFNDSRNKFHNICGRKSIKKVIEKKDLKMNNYLFQITNTNYIDMILNNITFKKILDAMIRKGRVEQSHVQLHH